MALSSYATGFQSPASRGIVVLAVAIAYFIVAKLTFLLPISNVPNDMISIAIWPAAGIAFAAYWRYGWAAWLGALMGSLLLHYSFDYSLSPLTVITAVAAVLPPLLARWLLLRSGTLDPFAGIAAVLRYALYAGLISPLCNTVVSVTALSWFTGMRTETLLSTGLIWWTIEAFTMLLVTPALMTWRDWARLSRERWLEVCLLVSAILLAFYVMFMNAAWTWAIPLAQLLLPPIYVALFRFNFGVMAGVSTLISLLAIIASSTHYSVELPAPNHYFYLLGFLTMQAVFNIIMCSALATARSTFDRLILSEERFRAMFEQAAVGIVLHDTHTRQHVTNSKLAEMLGYSQEELARMDQSELILPEDIAQPVEQSKRLRDGELTSFYHELRYLRRDGNIIWMGLTVSLIRSKLSNADFILSLFQDITARKNAEASVERLALCDYLTGLPNRRLFGDRLKKAVSSAQRSGNFGAVIYIDLDNFKHLNDTHGHSAGDDVLILVAKRLNKCLREEDTVARLGGDEFVALLQNIDDSLDGATDAVWRVARKILQSFQEPFVFAHNIEFFVTASIGVTLFPKGAETAEDLLKEADIAMYSVKDEQRNAIQFYAPQMKIEANLRISLEHDLRRALHRDELKLFLQPQYDAERTVVGCEALLRWPHHEGRMIPPNVFIPIAEETGLIVPLGEWVLRNAATFIHQFERAGLEISVSVNVSPRQFQEANFVDRVRTILWECGADAGRLIIEITEGLVVADIEDVQTKLQQLKGFGVRLSIDDFGTGHSSLAYLKRLPLHELKIDRTFVKDLPRDGNDAALVEAVLAMSRHLQLDVVAEGVETQEQFAFLKQRGCNRFQGYFFGYPKAPEEYFECLKIDSYSRPDYRAER